MKINLSVLKNNFFVSPCKFRFRKGYGRNLSLFILLFSSSLLWSQTTETFTISGTFTVPAGTIITTPTRVEAWGAGGGGGAATGFFGTGRAGGGGGGGFATSNITLTPGGYPVTVGNGGNGGGGLFGGDGSNGGNSIFASVTAYGGVGGSGTFNGIGDGGAGRTGIGTTSRKGGNGSRAASGYSGAGGGGAGSNVPGADGSGITGGSGGALQGGNGANGRNNGGSGSNGSDFGGGGSGGYAAIFAANTGGNGANGQVKITYFFPRITSVSPTSICAGNTFIITGRNFNSASAVTVGGTPVASFTVNSSTQITAIAGAGTTGVVRVATSHGSAISATNLTINPNITASVSIAASTNIICPGAGAPITFVATATNGGSAPSYQWKVNGINSGTNSPNFTTSGLTVGDVVTVVLTSNASPCLVGSPATSNAITIITQTTVFNDGSWTITPGPNLSAEIQSAYSTNAHGNLDVCALSITNGAQALINSGGNFRIRNGLNVLSGNLTIRNNGNLVQVNNSAINTGNITAEKTFTFSNDRKQYNYVISPVVGQSVKTIYPGNPIVIAYKESTNFFVASNGNYIPGKGYGIKEPTKVAVSTTTETAKYVGVPFNGILNYPLEFTTSATPADQGFNLVGNPYPSNLDIEALYDANVSKIGTTFYFWDNRGNTFFSQQGSEYTGDNYAKYNAYSGTGSGAGTKAPSIPGTGRVPTRYVKVGTGFMVQALSSANGQTLNYTNSMRSIINTGPGFFGKNGGEEKDRFWLVLKTPADMEFMNAVVYIDQGSKAFGKEDTEIFGASDAIFTLAEEKKLAIDGRDKFENTDVVQVGLSLFRSGEYSISIFEKEGVFANGQAVYLKDRATGTVSNLSEGNYVFNADAGEYTGRFEIIYQPETVLATEATSRENLVVYRDSNDFVVKAQTKKITDLEVYDTSGRMLYKTQPNQTKAVIPAGRLSNGVYILKIKQGDQTSTRKIIK